MLFQIDESIAALFSFNAATTKDFASLQYLALGAAEGSHRITGQRKVLLQLAQLQSLGLRERKTFERAATRRAEEGQLAHKLRVFRRVIANSQAIPASVVNGDQRIISIPLRWFDCSAKIQPIAILAENLADVHVLLKIGGVGALLASIGYLPQAALEVHGGAARPQLCSRN